MYDVIADHEASGVQVLDAWEVDLESYGEVELSDAELLEHAHLELLTAQAGGVAVLGSSTPVRLVDPIDEVLEEFDAQLAARERAEAALVVPPVAGHRDELAVRRERRIVRAALRTRIGGAA